MHTRTAVIGLAVSMGVLGAGCAGSSPTQAPPTQPSPTQAATSTVAATLPTVPTTVTPNGTATTPTTVTSSGAPTLPTIPPTVTPNGATATGGVDPNAPEVREVGDIPDDQQFVPYTTSTGLYTIDFPEGWSRTGDGDAVSFTDKFNAIEIAVIDKATAPTTDSVTVVDLPAIAAKAANLAIGKVSTVTRKGGDAILATYEIDSAPNEVTGKSIRVAVERYEFWKNGTSAVITLIGAVGADNVDPWKIVTDSFAWLK